MTKNLINNKFLKYNKGDATPELQIKYRAGLTLHPLDICLKKGIIPESSYKAANIMVFLYKLRYGKQVRLTSSYDAILREIGYNRPTIILDDDSLIRYTIYYQEVSTMLRKSESYDIILNVSVFSRFPKFLTSVQKNLIFKPEIFYEYNLFKIGLEDLVRYFTSKKIMSC
jgi:hypothetical protein